MRQATVLNAICFALLCSVALAKKPDARCGPGCQADRMRTARQVAKLLDKRKPHVNTAHVREPFADSQVYTVLGGAATGTAYTGAHTIDSQSTVAVLSARPDGPQGDMLSVLFVTRHELGERISIALRDYLDVQSDDSGLRATIQVHGPSAAPLSCAWMMNSAAHLARMFRIMCHAKDWHAREAMQQSRLNMSLSLSQPRAFDGAVNFTTEAIANLLAPARVSVCLDLAYFDYIPKRDFDEWAFAHELFGVERIYAPDLLKHRAQMSTQAARGLLIPAHEYVHRYVLPEPRNGTTTYRMKQTSDEVNNFICLHEHWYDDWVGVAWTPDEYVTFERMRDVPPPTSRTSLLAEQIQAFMEVELRSTAGPEPRWPFCMAEVCMNRPFYAPSAVVAGDADKWTYPNDGAQMRYSTETQLGVQRFTRRFTTLPKPTANRKCLVHPDWRLGTKPKVHGFYLASCPQRLQDSRACKSASHAPLRKPCLDLCGLWGNATCDSCRAAPAPGCGRLSPRYHTSALGEVMDGVEMAHFRNAPPENQVEGYTEMSWLSRMNVTLRPLIEASNHDPAAFVHDPLAEAYFGEAARLRGLLEAALPVDVIANAERAARERASALGLLTSRRGTDAELVPSSLEGLRSAIQVLRLHLSEALWAVSR